MIGWKWLLSPMDLQTIARQLRQDGCTLTHYVTYYREFSKSDHYSLISLHDVHIANMLQMLGVRSWTGLLFLLLNTIIHWVGLSMLYQLLLALRRKPKDFKDHVGFLWWFFRIESHTDDDTKWDRSKIFVCFSSTFSVRFSFYPFEIQNFIKSLTQGWNSKRES